MRWDKLFDDLESQLEQELSAEETDVGVEEERLRLGRLSLRDRLAGLREPDAGIVVVLSTGTRLRLRVDGLGRDWLSGEIEDAPPRLARCILPLDSVSSVILSASQSRESLRGDDAARSTLSERLGIAFVLRDLCRRRRAVEFSLSGGSAIHGTIDRVGRDHVDLAVHEAGSPRRESVVSEFRIVSLSSLVMVRY